MKTALKRALLYVVVALTFIAPLEPLAKTKYVDDKTHTFQKAKVTDVVDGDTIKVNIDGEEYKVRMILVDTPETVHPNKEVEPFGKEASNFTKKQLNGKTVYLEKDISDTDKYGRLLRYVWLRQPDNPLTKSDLYKYCFNSILLEKGYANLSTYPPDVSYVDFFRTRVKKARKNKVGLYSDLKDEPQKTKEPKDPKEPKKIVQKTKQITIGKNTYIADVTQGVIKGNKKSKIYHVEGQTGYNKISVNNVVFFDSEEEAISKGYRKAKR